VKFAYTASPARVVFGAGARAQLAGEITRLGATRVVIISSPGQARAADELARAIGATTYPHAVVHVPVAVADAAKAHAESIGADAYVAYGGGSAIGLAKAIAVATGHPIVAMPTTFSGSEATPVYGLTDGGIKRTTRDVRAQPRVIIYDPELYAALPAKVAGPSGINAIAHSVEALYAVDGNPAIDALAESSVRSLAAALPKLAEPAAREAAVAGAWLAGTCLASVAMALHHKLCHALGGAFDLPHAETHAIVLPHALAYNAPAAPAAMAALGRALDTNDPPRALFDLRAALGAPASLAELGVPKSGLAKIVELALATPYPNPRPLEREPLIALLEAAYTGTLSTNATYGV
jgi:maleylacetate reductase